MSLRIASGCHCLRHFLLFHSRSNRGYLVLLFASSHDPTASIPLIADDTSFLGRLVCVEAWMSGGGDSCFESLFD
jgi:hypothetical protein